VERPPPAARAARLTGLSASLRAGFPVERVSDQQYIYAFVLNAGKFSLYSNTVIPTGPLYVSFDGLFLGKTFINRSAAAVAVYFNAEPTGTIDPQGSLECLGQWSGVVARRGLVRSRVLRPKP